MISHLEPDILESEIRWALGSIITNKASGSDGIPAEPLQVLKDDAVKVLHSLCQEIWKTLPWPQDWEKVSFHLIPKKGNALNCSNYHTIALISHASRIMLKVLQARLQQYVNQELQGISAGFREVRGTWDQISNICWIIEKNTRVPEKHLVLLYWLHQSLCVDHNEVWKILQMMGIPDHLNLPPEKPVCRSSSNS